MGYLMPLYICTTHLWYPALAHQNTPKCTRVSAEIPAELFKTVKALETTPLSINR